MTDRTVVYRIQADVAQARAQVAALGTSVRKSADDMTAGTKEGAKFRQGLDSLGGAAGKVGLVAAVGLGAAIKKAADFDESMSKVEAATMESAAGMGRLRDAALEAGADTVFSATEAADGIEQLAKAGVATSDILGGGLRGALDLAAAGTIDVGTASEIAATTMNQFGLAGTEVTHIADVLAASAGKAMGEVTDMAQALKFVGPVAAQMGISLEETAGTIAYLASQGILGEQAGTSLRGMLTGLTSPSKIAADEMSRLGINMYDAQGGFVGLDGLAGQLQASMSNLGAAERDAALGRIFGNEQITAARILYAGGSEAVSKWTDEVNDSGFAAEVAALKLDNLKGDLEALGGSLETALINTGSGSQGPLRTLTQGITDVVNKYNDLPPAAQSASAAVLGVTAVAGGGIWAFAKAVDGISSVRTTLTNLGATAGGVKGKLASVASFVGGPWGFAFAGAALMLNDYMVQQAKTAGYVDALTAALEDQTGAMTRQAIAGNLQKDGEGWLEYANSIGLATDTVIDAALGSAEAMKAVQDAAGEHDGFFGGFGEAEDARQFVENIEAQAAAQKQAVRNTELLAAANGDAGESALEGGSATNVLTGATLSLGRAAYKTAEQVEAEEKALKDAEDAARDTGEQFFNLGDSLNDSSKSLGQWIADMREQADALKDFRKNAEQAANKGLRQGLIDALKEAGPEGALRMKQLANATKQEIAAANKAWQSGQREIGKYVAATARIPKSVSTVVNVDARNAIASMNSVLTGLQKVDGLRATSFIDVIKVPNKAVSRADGGPIYGPGTATSDSIPAYLSNGEYVIKAAAVEKYGVHMFDGLNAMRYAGGGSVSKGKEKPKKVRRELEVGTDPGTIAKQEAAAEAAARRQENLDNLAKDALAREDDRRERVAAMESDRLDAAKEWAEEQAEAEREHREAVLDGQTRAWDIMTDAAKSQADAAKEMRDSVVADMKRIGEAATSAFKSDWFTTSPQQHGLWTGADMGPAGDWKSIADADIAGLQERSGLITQLGAQGLKGAALEDLLGRAGNAAISDLLAKGEADDYAEKFDARALLMAAVGQQAGSAGYGAEWANAEAQFVAMNAKFDSLLAVIKTARPITVTESVSAPATAAEIVRLQTLGF